jgi:serine/threonine-protein kinase
MITRLVGRAVSESATTEEAPGIPVRAGRAASESATTEEAPGMLREGAVGSTTTADSSVTTGTGDAAARSSGRSDPRSRARRVAAAAMGLTAAAGIIAFGLSRAANQQDSVSPSEAAAPSVPAMAPAPAALPESTASVVATPPPPALQRARLAVSPADVSVEIDGAPAKVDGGEVTIEGAPGSRHRVRLFKGKDELRGEVILTEAGAAPSRMQLDASKPRPAAPPVGRAAGAPKATAATAPPNPTSTAGSLIPDTFR